jgi:hypothetical protein
VARQLHRCAGFADEVRAVQVTHDKDAERPFLPDPATLTDCLLLADRGYPSVAYFVAVRTQGGFFIVRLTRTSDPWVCAAWVEGDGRRCRRGSGCLAFWRSTRASVSISMSNFPTARGSSASASSSCPDVRRPLAGRLIN